MFETCLVYDGNEDETRFEGREVDAKENEKYWVWLSGYMNGQNCTLLAHRYWDEEPSLAMLVAWLKEWAKEKAASLPSCVLEQIRKAEWEQA